MVCIEKRPYTLYGRLATLHFRYLTCLLDRGHIIAGCFLSFKSRKELGLGDAKSPTSSALYIQGGTCSTLRDFNGASADLGRLASVKKGFLMENDAIALAEFLMRSVIVRFL